MQAEIIKLEQAQRKKSLAAKARQLAKTIHDQDTAAKLTDYAESLDRLHELCAMLRDTVVRTMALGAEVEELCTRQGRPLRGCTVGDAVLQTGCVDLQFNKRVGKPR